jgi:hypothetical protein
LNSGRGADMMRLIGFDAFNVLNPAPVCASA